MKVPPQPKKGRWGEYSVCPFVYNSNLSKECPMYSAEIMRNIEETFRLDRIGSSTPHGTMGLGAHIRLDRIPSDFRVNHYLLKSRADNELCDQDLPNDLKYLADLCYFFAPKVLGRYMYLTFDQKWIEPNQTHRDGGWHIDGLQGDEVPVKRPGDFCYMVSDCLPTQFYTGPMDLSDCDLSKDNIFTRLDERVQDVENNSIHTENNRLYLFDYAAIHRGTPATERVYRRLCRFHFTEVPITSTKLTVNPHVQYDYEIHRTNGNIPMHLK